MNYLSLEPFVPSGNNFEGSKNLPELGFTVTWGAGDYVGFENNGLNALFYSIIPIKSLLKILCSP